MYKITVRENGSDKTITRSKNYKNAKRQARDYASINPNAFFSFFYMYKDQELVETGQVISKRISWGKVDE